MRLSRRSRIIASRDVTCKKSGINKRKLIAGCIILTALLMACAFILWQNPFWYNQATKDTDYSQDTSAQFDIEPLLSSTDADDDGIDDQTDILQSARDYLATGPKYKSKYYDGGYPDDGYGVCTDVVAFACRGAGYDLKELLAEDVAAAPDAYEIETPDSNIDFRRVDNLNVYFSRHAQSLTTDLNDIKSWQGGDIVVFGTHVAIVSDKRNSKGIPYILHLVSPAQRAYEQDGMEHWEKKAGIMGHYRMGE